MPGRAERALVYLMRGIAAVSALAIVPVFMPHAWMDTCHQWLGLGPLEETPIIAYLTRSVSALYVMVAGIFWMASRNVRKHAEIVTYLSCAFVFFGMLVLWVDLKAGLPLSWILSEGPFIVTMGLVLLWLQRRAMRSDTTE